MNRIVTTLLAAMLVVTACGSTTPTTSPSSPSLAPTSVAAPTGTPIVLPDTTATPPATEGPLPSATTNPTSGATPTITPAPTLAPTPTPSPLPGGLQVLSAGQRDASPDVPAADLRALVRGNTAFALDLYAQLRKTNTGNIVFGPYSVSTAFGMLNPGAAGTTAQQIDDVLHFSLPTDRLDPAFDQLSLLLASRQSSKVEISIANRLFGQQGYPFQDAYLRELTTQFGAPMIALDYKHEWVQDRVLINTWVADQTNQRIKNLIPDAIPPLISPDTRFALVNAMYLNAKWAEPFNKAFTDDRPFVLATGTTVNVPTMADQRSAPIAITSDYQAVDLPYKGGELSMLLVMPNDLESFERSLNPGTLRQVVASLKDRGFDLWLPTFSVRTEAALKDALQAMGMQDAFDRGKADFSQMVDPADLAALNPPETLSVSAVIHQAWIKVAEAGTEAAAATAIIGGDTTGGGPDFSIHFDHPFLWFIRDRETGAVLFMGRVMDPSKQ
jgi:serpin B